MVQGYPTTSFLITPQQIWCWFGCFYASCDHLDDTFPLRYDLYSLEKFVHTKSERRCDEGIVKGDENCAGKHKLNAIQERLNNILVQPYKESKQD